MKPIRIHSLPGSAPTLPAKRPVSANRRIGGISANAHGAGFEKAIFLSQSDAGGRVVTLEKLPPCGARFVGGGSAHPLPIACDYVGCVRIVVPGLGLFFDAKSSAEEYGINLTNEKILKEHQAIFLEKMAESGAVAGILVECRRFGDYRWLDGKHLGTRRTAVKWGDERWVVLGPTTKIVPFRKLITSVLGMWRRK